MNKNVPEVGQWSKDKLDCLGEYLSAYTMIMKEQKKWCKGYIYIDAFSGAGTAKIKRKDTEEAWLFGNENDLLDQEQQNYIKGSPEVALGIKHPFTQYVFIEQDDKRYATLTCLKAKYPEAKIKILKEECNQYLRDRFSRTFDWKPYRGIIFIDPFNLSVDWETLEMIASKESFEVIINFSCMSINRLTERKGQVPTSHRQILSRFFGSDEWFDAIYQQQKGTSDDLFGHDKKQLDRNINASSSLLRWYKERLNKLFKCVSIAKLFRNSKNSPLYYIIWAGKNDKGLKIANHILSKGESI